MKSDPFITITDRKNIAAYMREFVLTPAQDKTIQFIPLITTVKNATWQGVAHKGGWLIEGAAPMAIHTEGNDVHYSMTNGDSNYRSFISSLKLSEIASIGLLPSYFSITKKLKPFTSQNP